MAFENLEDLFTELSSFKTNTCITYENLKKLNEVLKKSTSESCSVFIENTNKERFVYSEIDNVYSQLLIKCMEPNLLKEEDDVYLALLFQALALLLVLKIKFFTEPVSIAPKSYSKLCSCIVNSALRACAFWENAEDVIQTEFCLTTAEKFHIEMKDITECQDVSQTDLSELQDHQFLIFAHQIQLQDSFDKMFQAFQKAKSISQVVDQGNYLVYLSYNIAVKRYKKKLYEEGILWLKEGFQLAKETGLASNEQIIILSLLGDSYLKWKADEHWLQAANSFELAYNISQNVDFLIKRINAILHSKNSDTIKNVLWSTPVIFTLSEKNLKDIVYNLLSCKQIELALSFVNELCEKNGKWLPLKIKIVLNTQDFHNAEITCQRLLQNVDYFDKTEILGVCSDLAQNLKTVSETADDKGIAWINLCLKLLSKVETRASDVDVKNFRHVLQRQLCLKYLDAEEPTQTRLVLRELLREDMSLNTLAINLKTALTLGEKNEILKIINCLGPQVGDIKDDQDEGLTLLAYACGLAVKYNIGYVARASLKRLLEVTSNPQIRVQCLQALLKDLIQQTTDSSKEEALIKEVEEYLNQAYKELKNLRMAMVNPSQAAVWFMKVCWNLSIRHASRPRKFPLLQQCCEFMSLADVQTEPSIRLRYKTCLMMSVACGLHDLRMGPTDDNDSTLQQLANNISICKQILDNEQSTENDPTWKILILYEFEITCRLKDLAALETVYEQALSLPDTDAKYLELLITIAQGSGLWCAKIIIRLIKVAITKHLASQAPDLQQVSKNYCLMTQVLFEAEELIGLDAFNCLNGSLETLFAKSTWEFPEPELAWLVVKFWNYGVQQFSCDQKDSCEKWWRLARKMANHSFIVKEAYAATMDDHLKEKFPPENAKENTERLDIT